MRNFAMHIYREYVPSVKNNDSEQYSSVKLFTDEWVSKSMSNWVSEWGSNCINL